MFVFRIVRYVTIIYSSYIRITKNIGAIEKFIYISFRRHLLGQRMTEAA